jgi:hypothetical protein
MNDHTTDQSVLNHIQELVDQEHRLHVQDSMTDEDRTRLRDVQVELDQCWDLLRQRRALRGTGQDPDKAHVRPPNVVEKYEQ